MAPPLVYTNALALDSSVRTVLTAIEHAEPHTPSRTAIVAAAHIVDIPDSDSQDDTPVRPTNAPFTTLPTDPATRIKSNNVTLHGPIVVISDSDSDSDEEHRYPTHPTLSSVQDPGNRSRVLDRLARKVHAREREASSQHSSYSDPEFETLLANLHFDENHGKPIFIFIMLF